jgi:hypothetical protein
MVFSTSARASFVVAGQVFTSRIRTPAVLGVFAYFSRRSRAAVTNGSASSTTTRRRGARNGRVETAE